MNDEEYKVGGILEAIQATTKIKKIKRKYSSDEGDESKESDVTHALLTDLFTIKPELSRENVPEESEVKKYIEEDITEPTSTVKSEISGNTSEKKRKKKQKESPERLARTIFVGNVSVTVTRKMLKKIFMKFGEIDTIRIRSVPTADPKLPKKVALIKKDFHSERNNMNAYVVYKAKEDAVKAMKCNGILLEGLHLRVDSSNNKEHDHKKCLFVGNLPFSCLEEDIRTHFSNCGVIDDVRVIRDKSSGLGKGFCYIKFKSSDGVMFGLKLNGSSFKERKLRVYRSKEQPNQVGRSREKSKFGGLRSTTKKDIEQGKKLFGSVKSKKPNNAMRRIQDKQSKHKHARNKERNLNKKVYNKEKKKVKK